MTITQVKLIKKIVKQNKFHILYPFIIYLETPKQSTINRSQNHLYP